MKNNPNFEALVTQEQAYFPHATREVVARLLEGSLPRNTQFIAPGDKNYPPELMGLAETPVILVYKGDVKLLTRKPRLAIVGSRHSAASVGRRAAELTQALIAGGCTIIAGLADGLDTIVHDACIEAAKKTGNNAGLAVLGVPLAGAWPLGRHALARQICDAGGCLMSVAPQVSGLAFTTDERQASLYDRNLALVALAQGLLIMDAGEDSNTLRMADIACEINRPIFIWHEALANDPAWARRLKEKAGDGGVYVVKDLNKIATVLLD